ncbi:probetacellulin [Narcine bancroftii]|uniref:probetacellulin n=1 Tax=Narcine bancroftii TaxID=1343680 RepID=UPI00383131F9
MSRGYWGRAFSLVLVTGFTWCNQLATAVNSTSSVHGEKYLCGQRHQINCTEASQSKHFSKCPKRFESYCIQGQCRFMVSEEQPSCVCKPGYTGSRCEMVDMLYLISKQDQFIIMGLVLAMMVLIILIIIICICVHHYRRKCKGRRMWRLGVEPVSTRPPEEMDAQGENEDTLA